MGVQGAVATAERGLAIGEARAPAAWSVGLWCIKWHAVWPCGVCTLSCSTGESPRTEPFPEMLLPCTCTPTAMSLSLSPITGSKAGGGGSDLGQQQPMETLG